MRSSVLVDDEPEYDQEARGKLAAAGLTSDEEEDRLGGASGYDTDSNQAEAGQKLIGDTEDAELAAAEATKGQKQRKRKTKQSRSRSKSREPSAKGTPRLKKRAREQGQLSLQLKLCSCPLIALVALLNARQQIACSYYPVPLRE